MQLGDEQPLVSNIIRSKIPKLERMPAIREENERVGRHPRCSIKLRAKA